MRTLFPVVQLRGLETVSVRVCVVVALALSVLVIDKTYVPATTVLRYLRTTCVFDDEVIEMPEFAGETERL